MSTPGPTRQAPRTDAIEGAERSNQPSGATTAAVPKTAARPSKRPATSPVGTQAKRQQVQKDIETNERKQQRLIDEMAELQQKADLLERLDLTEQTLACSRTVEWHYDLLVDQTGNDKVFEQVLIDVTGDSPRVGDLESVAAAIYLVKTGLDGYDDVIDDAGEILERLRRARANAQEEPREEVAGGGEEQGGEEQADQEKLG